MAGRRRVLRRWDDRLIDLNGRAHDLQLRRSRQLHVASGFPDWCGHNWDAFNDCFGDYVEEDDGALIAVVWRDIDVAARQAPATTAEMGSGLLDCKFGHMPTLAPGAHWSLTMDILVVGEGTDFCHPD